MTLRARLTKYAEMVTVYGILGAFLTGFVALTGGHLPPWVDYAEAASIRETVENDMAEIRTKQEQSDILIHGVYLNYLATERDHYEDLVRDDPNNSAYRQRLRELNEQIENLKAGKPVIIR